MSYRDMQKKGRKSRFFVAALLRMTSKLAVILNAVKDLLCLRIAVEEK